MFSFKLKLFDLFGAQFAFTTNKDKVYKSTLGGIISLIVVAIITMYAIILIQTEFQRIDPNIVNEYYSTSNYSGFNLTNDNFFIGFRFENDTNVIDDYYNYFTIDSSIIKYDIDIISWNSSYILDIENKNCKDIIGKSFDSSEKEKQLFEGYQCLDFSNFKQNNCFSFSLESNDFPIISLQFLFSISKI